MNIENDIFKRYVPIKDKLIEYGFIYNENTYTLKKKLPFDSFYYVLSICGKDIIGNVYDGFDNIPYNNFRVVNATGEFVNKIKDVYISSLLDIREKCFKEKYFIFDQSNRITDAIINKYDIKPEFLWKDSNFGVFRNNNSDKWFGLIMNIDYSKIDSTKSGEIEVINIKVNDSKEYLNVNGIYSAYHMNKKSWISIILDDTLTDSYILDLINISFNNSTVKGEWIVPANPKYYDVIHAFDNTDIINWKQSSNIKVGDIIYLYVANPYSSIMFKCIALEVNIPVSIKHDKLKIDRLVKIKLLKRYNQGELSFDLLKQYGVSAIRGPRSVPLKLSKYLNEE
ncbi:MAG: MmcQ/YjbR family DNA-binding protein [Bacilli bacterium]|nr:MmcQ/YjbR family DNA-binding protein [Bacilli bacterium]